MKSSKTHWAFARTLLLLIVGLLNTVFIRSEDIGTWKNYVGYAVLLLAIVDVFFLVQHYLKCKN